MAPPGRYRYFATVYDVLSGEWPIYRAGRVAGVSDLDPRPGQAVLGVGCGTGLNYPLLARAVGPTGRIVGLDAPAAMHPDHVDDRVRYLALNRAH